jgi:hypothetical protein
VIDAAVEREFDVAVAGVDVGVAFDRWCARSIVTEGVDCDDRADDWCADGIGRTVADVERTVTSSDAGSPIVLARPVNKTLKN